VKIEAVRATAQSGLTRGTPIPVPESAEPTLPAQPESAGKAKTKYEGPLFELEQLRAELAREKKRTAWEAAERDEYKQRAEAAEQTVERLRTPGALPKDGPSHE
jgi:hypothetical protein